MKRGGTHFNSDARDAMFGGTVQRSTVAATDTATALKPKVLEIRFSKVFGGWTVETDDDNMSIFKDEESAKAWIAENCR